MVDESTHTKINNDEVLTAMNAPPVATIISGPMKRTQSVVTSSPMKRTPSVVPGMQRTSSMAGSAFKAPTPRE